MGSKICCTTRAPPSPDGLAPRPAKELSPSKVYSSGTFVAPWSIPASPLSNPNDVADLQAIFEDDKSSIDDGLERTKPKKSANAVHAVAARLKKRLSRDMSIAESTKRYSRSSVGSSEEEIGRRAELRRIRQRRIEEELSNDIYDDDAKSFSTTCGGNSTLGRVSRATRDGEYLPPPSLTPPTLTFPGVSRSYFDSSLAPSTSAVQDQFNPSGIIYPPSRNDYEVPPISRQPSAARSENDRKHLSQIKSIAFSKAKVQRRHSFPRMCVHSSSFVPDIHQPERNVSTTHPVPTRPMLQAMRLPSITDSALYSSWRLSFTFPKRGKHLRQLNGEYVGNPLTSIWPLPSNKWLHSQGLHSSSQAMMNSEDSGIIDCVSPTYSGNEDFGGVDGSPASISPMHLYEMAISQRLVSGSLDSTTSTKPLPNKGIHNYRRFVSSSAYSHSTQVNLSPYVKHLDCPPPIDWIPDSWSTFLKDDHSTSHDSAVNSIQQSPNISSSNLLTATSRIKGTNVEVSNEAYSVLPTSNLTTLNLDSLSAVTMPLARRHSRLKADSNGISDTDSHCQLEAELKVVQTRFADSVSRLNVPVPIVSRFHEEFGLEVAVGVTSSPLSSRQSISAYIDRSDLPTLDGTMEKMLGVPLPPVSRAPNKNISGIAMNSPAEDSTLDIWGKAVKEVQNEVKTEKGRNKSIFPHDLGGASLSRRAGSKIQVSNDDKNIKGEDYDTLMAKKEDILDEWEREMEDTAKRAKAISKKAAQKATRQAKLSPDRRYPTSWSKFPSFNRRERTEQTKTGALFDSIERRDFAIHATNGEDTLWYRNEQSHHPHHYDNDDCEIKGSKGFIKKLEDKIKFHIPPAVKDSELISDQTFGRKGSVFPSVPLEFPELEILAVETENLMTDEQIEEHVAGMIIREEAEKKEEDLQRKEDELDVIFSRPRRVGKESTISRARKAAEERKAKEAAELTHRRREKLDQFGMKLEVGPSRLLSGDETAGGPVSNKKEKKLSETVKKATSEAKHPDTVEKELDTAGMNRTTLAHQIDERAALKKKIEERKKAEGGVRRGPVARAKPELVISGSIQQALAFQRSTGPEPTEYTKSQRSSGAMRGNQINLDRILFENNTEHDYEIDNSPISIADPRFYEDCIIGGFLNTSSEGQSEKLNIDNMMMRFRSLRFQNSNDDRFRTWNGMAKDRCGHVRLVRSVGDIGSRKREDRDKY